VLETCGHDELIVTLESDTTSDLDAVEAMLAAAGGGADIVLASHHGTGELANVSAHRRFLSRAASSVIRRGGGLDASTVSSFFRVYRAETLRAGYGRYGESLIQERGFACKAEILIKLSRMGITVAEVPVTLDWAKREGESKMKVLPTMGGYARLMARQTFARARS
jgi:dolichol-phosphate mannosyltransferase